MEILRRSIFTEKIFTVQYVPHMVSGILQETLVTGKHVSKMKELVWCSRIVTLLA